MLIPFITTIAPPEAPPEAHSPTDEPQTTPPPGELVKALPLPDERPQTPDEPPPPPLHDGAGDASERHLLDSSPTTEEEARRNAALAKSQRIVTAARAIAEALKGLDDSESLEAVYMGNKRARGGL